MAILYVVGNGFDRHHGMATRYHDFATHLALVNRDLHELIDAYFPTYDACDFWGHFEERLASFDADTLIEQSEHFIVPYGAEDWSDAYHHDYALELDRVVRALSERLVEAFSDWIRGVAIPTRGSLTAPSLRLDPGARFINFNYTSVLQDLYGVPDARIWHIHGRAADQTLVLGHGWHRTPAETYVARLHPTRDDTRVLDGAKTIDRYFELSFKPTDQIIAGNATWFASLSDVDEVRVLGHSLSDVDLPYFERIAANVLPSAQWRISYYEHPTSEQRQIAKLPNVTNATFLQITDV